MPVSSVSGRGGPFTSHRLVFTSGVCLHVRWIDWFGFSSILCVMYEWVLICIYSVLNLIHVWYADIEHKIVSQQHKGLLIIHFRM